MQGSNVIRIPNTDIICIYNIGINSKAQKPWWHCQGCMVVGYSYGVYYHDLVLQRKYFTIIMHKPQPSALKSIVFKTCQVSSIGSCQCEIEPYSLTLGIFLLHYSNV